MLATIDLTSDKPDDPSSTSGSDSFLSDLHLRVRSTNNVSTEDVQKIIDDVRSRQDQALYELAMKHDGVELKSLTVTKSQMEESLRGLDPSLREAMEDAADNIRTFCAATRPEDAVYNISCFEIRTIHKAVASAGCYVPGGLANYPSTVMMTAIPARVAGCSTVSVCTPPTASGLPSDVVMAAGAISEVDEMYCIGGPGAIAAMAYGTETVRATDVVCGPGNKYVSEAKRLVSSHVGVPASFTGPSEVVVIADETTSTRAVAFDLIAQAEHGPGGLACLVTWSKEAANAIALAIEELVAISPRRSVVESTLKDGGYIVLVDDAKAAVRAVNEIAPEHLQIMNVDPEALLPHIKNAGAIFIGQYTPASLGDYIAGPSHVLPVYGTSRFGSGLNVADFIRCQNVISTDKDGLEKVAPMVEVMALAEGLPAHADSVFNR